MSWWNSPRESWSGVTGSFIDGLVLEQTLSTVNSAAFRFRGRNLPHLKSVEHYADVQCGCGAYDHWPDRNDTARNWGKGIGVVFDAVVVFGGITYLQGNNSGFMESMAIIAGAKLGGQAMGALYHLGCYAIDKMKARERKIDIGFDSLD